MLRPILLVEDNPEDVERSLVAPGRRQLANEVVVARDGAEALDCLRALGSYAERPRGNPAVVLLDPKLPKVGGLRGLERIKGAPELQGISVVILTSPREEEDLLRGYRLGVNAYVVKPVSFQEFIEAIQEPGVFWAPINGPPPGSLRTRR